MSMRFDLVSVTKENEKEGTIRFTIDGGDLKKCPKPSITLSGTTFRISITCDGDEYAHEIHNMEIQDGMKSKVDKTYIDVTVVKKRPFKLAPLIQV